MHQADFKQARKYVPDGNQGRTASTADIAIVGMACRFPCAADYDHYWRNLVSERNCIREVPNDRWNWRKYAGDPSLEHGQTSVKWGGFIDDIDKFDPLFFGISPMEAAFIDPQHRLFLEAAWHAVEDAGYSVASLSGRTIGVYAGVSKNDYGELMRESRHEIVPYISTGTVHSILVNRVSFLFNLHGKSEAVDTACSSSLVALHNAIRDIANGECEAAIVGGVNALIAPTMFVSHSKSGMLSPDGQCKTFSEDANGYVRSEGVGVLFIKPFSQAMRDGDHVHAVIKSSAINHGGRSNFLTSPSTEAQAAVVIKALRSGNIDPWSIDYIECHGTGTPLGDPIEINGLQKAFAELALEFSNRRDTYSPHCALGSVKTNIGHLESASGMAGIIKVLMAMKHRQIPAIRNFSRLNPYVELDNSPFFIATETMPWPKRETPRRAGVSSFGMGGVNAHVVLEEAPQLKAAAEAERLDWVIPLSAKKDRLKAYAASLFNYLLQHQNDPSTARVRLCDVAYTLQTGRDVFDERVALVAASMGELLANLEMYVTGVIAGPRAVHVGDSRGYNEAAGEWCGVERPLKADELAARWVRGAKVDWSEFNAGYPPRRVALPTYPFARKRCWFTDVASKAANPTPPDSIPSQVEPIRSVRTLRKTDFFIRDHVVGGKAMLPGVVHLELARAAGSLRRGDLQQVRILKDVYWLTPVVVETDDVDIEVRLTSQNDRVNFEVLQKQTVHSKGSLADLPSGGFNRPKLDIPAIEIRCGVGRTKPELYGFLKEHGLAYGSSFQVIERYVHNELEILAELKLPTEVKEGLEDYVLHPSIMDGVFQAVTALSVLGLHHSGKQVVPFYLEAAEIVNPIGNHCFVYATANAGQGKLASFDASLCDCDGNVLVYLKNLQKRPIVDGRQIETAPSTHRDIYYRPMWTRKELSQRGDSGAKTLLLFAHEAEVAQSFRRYGRMSGTIVVIRPSAVYRRVAETVYEINPRAYADYESLLQELKAEGCPPTQIAYLWGLGVPDSDDLESGLDTAIYDVLNLTQAAFKVRLHGNLNLVYAYALGQGFAQSLHSMVAGLARTLKYENPAFDYLTIGFDEPVIETVAQAVCAELSAAPNENTLKEVIFRGGQRYERKVVRQTVPEHWETGDRPQTIKRGGVYLISGGAGGLGCVFARYLTESYGATILSLGRSIMNPEITAKVRIIEEGGGKCEYFSVDITDPEALTAVLTQFQTAYGPINGVIHAAGLIEDAFILQKTTDSFARVISPKVVGAINLDVLTRREKLDFFVVFSSIAALMPNQGQCDYAAANSFLDSFAEARNRLTVENQRSGVTLSLNWPLWAHGGIGVSSAEERHLENVFGMKPLTTGDGLAIFETALALAKVNFPDTHQIIAIDGDKEKIARGLGLATSRGSRGATNTTETPWARVETEIKSIFATHLGVAPGTIDSARTIGELGIDSSTVVGVTADINARFDAHLKPTLLFDINTVDKLATHMRAIGKNKAAAQAGYEAPRWNRSLIDVVQSDPTSLMFSKTFKTSEFYLRDHVVDGRYNMPGACYVEMARQAADLLLGENSARRLVHNYWASPLSSHGEDFTAHVHFKLEQGHYAYEIVSFTFTGDRRLHALGQITTDETTTPAEIRIDIAHVTSLCDGIQYPLEIYEQIRSEGLMVGPTFQPMKQILLNASEALARLELPEAIKSTVGDYILNPALLTGAFQAALIINRRSAGNTRQYIPIGMDELEVIAPIPADCYVYCRSRPANVRNEEMRKFDLEICRLDGLVVVRLRGFSIRALRETVTLAGAGSNAGEETSNCHASEAMFDAGQDRNRPTTASDLSVEQIDEVRAYLRSLIARPIGLSVDEIEFYTGFDQYGVNSVMVVELNEILANIFGQLSKTLFFEYRSIDELSRYFLDEHRAKILAALPAKRKTDGRLRSDVPIGGNSSNDVSLKTDSSPHAMNGGVHEQRDIAIVGAAGRFPGARNLGEFWEVLREGRDCITEIPPDRFNYRKYFDADPERGGIYSKWGGFIDDVDRFDSAFFNISPREAELIDPQERLLLEVVWEMLEHAGYTRRRLLKLSDRRVGVFVGALWQPYEGVGIEATFSGNVVGPSSLLYSVANRISYFFDLAGPSMAIDTACSSSLTALHLACQSIRSGESQTAIVAGVNLSLTVSKYLFLSRHRFLSTDGRCRSYGAGGDGYVPGEGICALLVKPLAKAIADGDSIMAVIKGSAINHGGRTNGYTVPNPKAQGNAIEQAMEEACVDPHAITYIEGHGTGTSLGDPIEIAGLEKALGVARDENWFCAIGSVKSNIGHLEAAAGIASIIKVILQMQNRQFAPSLHTENLNPNIDFGRSRFRVQRELAPWPRPEFIKDGKLELSKRCAGVSSFGAGGSNAHLILEEYDGPSAPALRDNHAISSPALCVFSARTEERLFALIGRFEEYLRKTEPDNLHDLAYTLQLGREAMRERLAVVASSVDELRTALADFLKHKQQQNNWRLGRAAGRGGRTDGIANTDFETIEEWWQGKNLIQVAEAWVRGVEIDWTHFYGGCNYGFLSLPTYPFAKERYWIDTASDIGAAVGGSPASVAAAVFHPLLHRNTSDLSEQRYSSTFTGAEFFLEDHRVRTDDRTIQKVLPGVACLEIARVAIEHAMPGRSESAFLELQNTVWTQPIVVAQNRQISIALWANGHEQIDYEIYSEDGEQEVVHCQGRAVWSGQPALARLDLQRLKEQMGRGKLESNSVYRTLARRGLVLGPAFQAITAIHLGNKQLLAYLRLPRAAEDNSGNYVLHPSLLDGALEGSLGLIDGWDERSDRLRVPFALESVCILSPCTPEMVAWMRYSPDSQPGDHVVKLDVDLCDEQGRVCVRMKGFASRALEGGLGEGRRRRLEKVGDEALPEMEEEVPAALVTLAPVWEVVKVEVGEVRPRAGDRVVVIGGEEEQQRALRQERPEAEVLQVDGRATVEELAEKLRRGGRIDHVVWILPQAKERGGKSEAFIEEQEQGVLLGFRLIKALLREGYGARGLAWTVITNETERIGRGEENLDPAHSSVKGLVGSMAKEYGNWNVRLVDMGGRVWPWGEMLRLGWDQRGEGHAYRDGQWHRRRLIECELGEKESKGEKKEYGYKRGGVYVVIGGAGGVGEVVSEYLIRRYDARVVWTGRREKDEAIEKKQKQAAAAGGERPFYIAADARNREQLEQACKEIKERYGRINGVIHSAIVLADKSLANMEEEQFRAALSAKVDVAVRLAQVFGREPLDFILYFSSVQSFLTLPGQSNYAAGCTFADAFAQWQSESVDYAVKVMNWGYWGRVGIASGAEYQERMARLGLGSIDAEEGMAGLERLLKGPLEQVGMIWTKGVEATRALGVAVGEGMWAAREKQQPQLDLLQKHPATARPRGRLSAAVPSPALPTINSSATEERRDLGLLEKVETWLVEAVGMLLKVRKEDIDVDAELSEFGFDSLSLTGFANHVNQVHGLELMPTIFFERPTVRSFARHLVEKHGERLAENLIRPQRPATATPRQKVSGVVSLPPLPTITSSANEESADSGLLKQVETWLMEAVGVLLKVKTADIDLDAELSEFGFDSLSLTGFANLVNQAYGLELIPTIFFEHPTARTFAKHLVEKHGERLAEKFRVAGAGSGTTAARGRSEELSQRVVRGWNGRKRGRAQSDGKVAPRFKAEEAEETGGGAEAIAIIGMSGRFPGAEDLDQFWENLKAGTDNIVEIPLERWDWRALYGDEKEDGNQSSVKWGAFMEGVDEFDPLFFGISPREAELMDPQHRLTLMYGWKAFEDAGYGPRQLWGSRTGIFVGTANTGYGELLTQSGTGIEGYTATGLVPSVGPNRLSYLLNLHGPSEPIETACSSSLVAVHRAVRAIIGGECEMALAGGVNTLFPTLHISFSKAGMLSRDGKCKTFSDRADGYVRGEGVGMVVLKRLGTAERDGDHIYGLIRGSAENHGGRAQSLTAPNPQAQTELIKDAYRRAGVSPRSVSYIEAHGTGTALGDPVEINGLKNAFQGLYEEMGEEAGTGYCGLGSVKSNIGHLELAAGIAGMLKILLQLKHGLLVRSLHCEEVNPYIRLEASPFYIVRENQPWKKLVDEDGRELPLLAGVSSFGFGGVNAHVLIEEYTGGSALNRESKSVGREQGPVMVVLSAKDAERLKERATQLQQVIARGELSDSALADVAFTLQVGREAMDHRVGMTVGSTKELEAKLEAFIEGKSGIEGLRRGEVKRNSETLAVFRGDEELHEAVGKWIHRGKCSKLLELWVKGLEIEWEQMYRGHTPRRLSLPTYPFAKDRYWPAGGPLAARSAAIAVLHPLLHSNTSDLAEQRYDTTFTGEDFFLKDHSVRMDGGPAQKVLPGVVYLEMARAAMAQASPSQQGARALELNNTVWLKPVIVEEQTQLSITLFANDDDQVAFEIYSMDAQQRVIHCQGEAIFASPFATPTKLDLERLNAQMKLGRLEASDIYPMFAKMGLDYGPTHQAIITIHLGEKQLLAQLRLPAALETTEHEYVLHPSLMDGALQASIGLMIDLNHLPSNPPVPFVLESLRIESDCTREMSAWVRYSEESQPDDKAIKLDIDLCDPQGNICVHLRGFASRVLEGEVKSTAQNAATHRIHASSHRVSEAIRPFDDAFYENLVADIATRKVSVDEAVELG